MGTPHLPLAEALRQLGAVEEFRGVFPDPWLDESFAEEEPALRAALPEPLVSELAPGVRTLTLAEGSGKIRLALMSTAETYTTTRCRFADRVTALRKISPFPYMPLELRDHELSSPDFRPTVNLPPHGMILLELETDHNEEHKTC